MDFLIKEFCIDNSLSIQEKFEDIKGVIRIGKSKDRQYTDHMERGKHNQ